MTVRTDLEAIRDDGTKTEDEKRALTYEAKVDAIVTRLQALVGQNWTDSGVTYSIPTAPANGWQFPHVGLLTAPITKHTVNGVTTLTIVVQRSGAGFNALDTAVYVNPPLTHNGIDIDAMNAAQRAAYGRMLLANLPPVT